MDIPIDVEIRDSHGKGRGVFTKRHIQSGYTVFSFNKPVLRPNHLAKITAIQIDINTYLDSGDVEVRDFLNHSCSPNCRVDVKNVCLIAIRDIMANEEITFNYCSTEFDLDAKNESFNCSCGSPDCIGIIKGFNHLNTEQKKKLEPILAPYLLRV